MKTKWRQILSRRFEDRLKEELPEFERDLAQERSLPGGTRVFRRQISSERDLFVLLVLSPKSGCFTLEGAWADDGHYPSYTTPLLPEELDPTAEKGRFRIGSLMPGDSPDHWWWVRSAREVPAALEEAIRAVREALVPFFEGLSQARSSE